MNEFNPFVRLEFWLEWRKEKKLRSEVYMKNNLSIVKEYWILKHGLF